MFSVEIKVNGVLAAHVMGENIGNVGDGKECLYNYHLYDTKEACVNSSEIVHDQDDGILTLVKEILKKETKGS